MTDITERMTRQEKVAYSEYIDKFLHAFKVMYGCETIKITMAQFYVEVLEWIEGYIDLMLKYIPDLSFDKNGDNSAVKLFVIKEIQRPI